MKIFKLLISIVLYVLLNDPIFGQSIFSRPGNLKVEPGSASHFNLEWTDQSEGEEGFIIERKKKDENYWAKIGFVPVNTTQFQAGGCLAESKYAFRVRAFKGSIYSEYSEIKSSTTLQYPNSQQSKVVESSTPRQGEGTMLKLANGDIQMYYNSISGMGDRDISQIARIVSSDEGKTWSDKEIIFHEDGVSLLHPSVVTFKGGKIGIAYSKMIKDVWTAFKVFRYSTDGGQTWSDETKVSGDFHEYTTGSHDRFVTLSNHLVVNVVHSVLPKGESRVKGKLLGTDLFASRDQGLTWFRLNDETIVNYENPYGLGEFGFYEASLVEYEPGKLVLFGRSATGFLLRSTSEDFGKTWSTPEKVGIQHPLAPARAELIPGTNKILLIHNPMKNLTSNRGIDDRYILASRISDDGGITWHHYKQLEYDGENQYSYPAILIDDNTVHIFHWKTGWDKETNNPTKTDLAYRKLTLSFFTED